jgi:hypothetical protein
VRYSDYREMARRNRGNPAALFIAFGRIWVGINREIRRLIPHGTSTVSCTDSMVLHWLHGFTDSKLYQLPLGRTGDLESTRTGRICTLEFRFPGNDSRMRFFSRFPRLPPAVVRITNDCLGTVNFCYDRRWCHVARKW